MDSITDWNDESRVYFDGMIGTGLQDRIITHTGGLFSRIRVWYIEQYNEKKLYK